MHNVKYIFIHAITFKVKSKLIDLCCQDILYES